MYYNYKSIVTRGICIRNFYRDIVQFHPSPTQISRALFLRYFSGLRIRCILQRRAAEKYRSPIGSRRPAQTLRSEQTGGPISGVFAGGLAILLDTLFRSSDADTDAHAVVEEPGRE